MKKCILYLLLILCLSRISFAQNYPIQTLSGSAQTSNIIPVRIAGTGIVQVTGVSLTTATFAVQGSLDGTTYFALPITNISTATSALTQTVTGPGLFSVSLVGINYVKFVTSGTFTGTSISMYLGTSQLVAKSSSGGVSGGSGGGASSSNPISTIAAEYAFDAGAGAATTTITDISGNNNNGTFCSGHAPTWVVDGLQFLSPGSFSDNGTYSCATVPGITTFKSIAITFETFPPVPSGTGSGLGVAVYGAALVGPSPGSGSGRQITTAPNVYAMVPRMVDTGSGGVISGTIQGYSGRHTLIWVSGTPDAFYIDGVLQTLSTANGGATVPSFAGGMYFGTAAYAGANGFKGKILYTTIDTTTNWTAAQAVLENSYIQNRIASRALTPYSPTAQGSARGPQVIVAGDSLNAGRGGNGLWTSLLALNNTYTVTNSGVSGMLLHDFDWSYNQQTSPYVNMNGGRCYAVTDGGANELVLGPYGLNADAWSSAVSWAKQVRNSGCIPLFSTMIDQGNGSSDSTIAAYNAIIRANWQSAGFAGIVDDAERAEFAPNAVTGNATYYADQTHLTGPSSSCTGATGYGLRCLGLSRVINTLDGSTKANPTITASNAYVPTDAAGFTVQTPTASATYQLVDCSFITGQTKTIVNASASFAITVGTTSSQTIIGSTSIPANTSASFTAEVSSGNAGGCYWLRN